MKDFSMINAIKELVNIKSDESDAIADMPFGKGVYDALHYTLSLADSFGLKTKNYDNYIGEVVLEGKDVLKGVSSPETQLAVLCHLDTVPAGNGWSVPPYKATEKDGKIYGRGIVDDKAAAIICLYALKNMKEENYIPEKTVKLILGCDEESGWKCIQHYKEKAVLPDEGFSPDADFPVIYAEKGIFHFTVNFPCDKKIKVKGGERVNMVCDFVTLSGISDDITNLTEYGFFQEGNNYCVKGKTAHGSHPELGENAIEKTLRLFSDYGIIERKFYDILFNDSLNLTKITDESGALTLSPDIIFAENGKMSITCDIRYPALSSLRLITDSLDGAGLNYEIISHQPPLYNDKKGKLVSTLLNIYNSESGKQGKPIAIGGGTYARALKNGVGFGPEFEGEKSMAHQPDEYLEINKIEFLYNVYYKAIKELSK